MEVTFRNQMVVRSSFLFVDDDGTVLGEVWLLNFGQRCELGYKIPKGLRGKGVAAECVSSLCAYTFSRSQAQRIEAYVLPDNAASIRVLEKCGFQIAGDPLEEGHLHFALAKPA